MIDQSHTLGAESHIEPQEDPFPDENEADLGVSVAVNIANINNQAQVTIHSEPTANGWQAAQLDALRATRIISDVAYPFLTRFDQYIPLSWGEVLDNIRSQGVGALTKYLTTTFGLTDAFFNTWVGATAEAEEVSIAASVNILVQNNDSKAIVESGVLKTRRTAVAATLAMILLPVNPRAEEKVSLTERDNWQAEFSGREVVRRYRC